MQIKKNIKKNPSLRWFKHKNDNHHVPVEWTTNCWQLLCLHNAQHRNRVNWADNSPSKADELTSQNTGRKERKVRVAGPINITPTRNVITFVINKLIIPLQLMTDKPRPVTTRPGRAWAAIGDTVKQLGQCKVTRVMLQGIGYLSMQWASQEQVILSFFFFFLIVNLMRKWQWTPLEQFIHLLFCLQDFSPGSLRKDSE